MQCSWFIGSGVAWERSVFVCLKVFLLLLIISNDCLSVSVFFWGFNSVFGFAIVFDDFWKPLAVLLWAFQGVESVLNIFLGFLITHISNV